MIPLFKARSLLPKIAESLEPQKAHQILDKLIGMLKKHPQIQELFDRFGVPVEVIEQIPIKFKQMDVSAKAKEGVIYLNSQLLEDGDIVDDFHYVVHEIVHFLQQKTGLVNDFGDLRDVDYLNNPLEIDAFREQIKFMADSDGREKANEYLNQLLDFHDIKDKVRSHKYNELGGT